MPLPEEDPSINQEELQSKIEEGKAEYLNALITDLQKHPKFIEVIKKIINANK